jgi:hypothetical protein
MGKKLSPKDLARYSIEHGKPITEAKLGQLRGTGEGPEFYKEDGGKRIWYDPDDFDKWNPIEKKPKPMTKYSSTAEYRKKKGEGK